MHDPGQRAAVANTGGHVCAALAHWASHLNLHMHFERYSEGNSGIETWQKVVGSSQLPWKCTRLCNCLQFCRAWFGLCKQVNNVLESASSRTQSW